MPKCQFLFSAVFGFRNPTQEIFSELDETKAHGPIFHGVFQNIEEESEWASRGPPHRAAWPGPLPRPGMGSPPPGSPGAASSPIYSFVSENPSTESQNTRKVTETPRPSIPSRGILKISSGTLPERGIITRGLYITMPAFGLMRE